MKKSTFHTLLTYCIATVWIVNGLFCKVLNWVPRHELIVATILGNEHAHLLTVMIGTAELLMGIWVISKIKTQWNAIAQILIVATMNILEFFLVPDLLLWGKFNSLFALLFIIVVYYNEFTLNKQLTANHL